jgi:UDP-N-acetylglucosamine 2-epimerase
MKKIITVVGARPQFIKLAALSKALRKQFNEVIIHTGQHYDYEMSKSFFDELEIPDVDYNLEVGSGLAGFQIGTMLIKLEEIFLKEKPDCVIVFGDTNSTAAAAIAAVKNKIKLGHVEAGLREFNKYIPEESNKLITDILTDFYFCPTPTAIDILDSMGIKEGVYNIGDVMIDIILLNWEKILSNNIPFDNYNIIKKEYVLLTCHRANNTDDKENLEQILSSLSEIKETIIFPIHPRTLKAIETYNFNHYLEHKHIIVTKPLGYIDTQTLIHYAKFVLTDSGGVTKEAYFHEVPGILLDLQTEWVETIKEGWNQQAGPNKQNILKAYKNLLIPSFNSKCLGDGKASEKIVEILLEKL